MIKNAKFMSPLAFFLSSLMVTETPSVVQERLAVRTSRLVAPRPVSAWFEELRCRRQVTVRMLEQWRQSGQISRSLESDVGSWD